uniref:Uncharacterized protein n=1 Tax=viral metagenome TaxID=1070528 RepID=A0A6H1ZP30_9ZZZZ
MAATLVTGYSFSTTEWVTAAKLNALVGSATISGIVNAEIAAAAAIAYSKLALTGYIKNADITAAAGIPYSKLTLTDSIVDADIASASPITYTNMSLTDSILNADINSAALIDLSKLATGASAQVIVVNASAVPAYTTISGDVTIGNTGITSIGAGVITNTDISAAAGIPYSKLTLTGTITNADVSAAAGIVYSKLTLTDSITDADIASASPLTYANMNLADSLLNADIYSSADIIHTKLDFTGFDADSYVSSGNTTTKGKVEIAIASEVNTGTDTDRAISPDALAGSLLGRKIVEVVPFEASTDVAVGDGKAYLVISPALNGMDLVYANALTITTGSSGNTTVMIYNVTDSVDMLDVAITIASGANLGTSGTIASATKNVSVGELLRLDIDSVSTTANAGMIAMMEFQLP